MGLLDSCLPVAERCAIVGPGHFPARVHSPALALPWLDLVEPLRELDQSCVRLDRLDWEQRGRKQRGREPDRDRKLPDTGRSNCCSWRRRESHRHVEELREPVDSKSQVRRPMQSIPERVAELGRLPNSVAARSPKGCWKPSRRSGRGLGGGELKWIG